MAAVAVERPMTAQQRVLCANDPPAGQQRGKQQQQTYHQRVTTNARGAGVASALHGDARGPEPEPQQTPPRKVPQTNPSEFLTGPTEPGHVKRGVRRYDERNGSTVGMALTEEWILGRKEGDPMPTHMTRQRGPKDNMEGPSCSIKRDEPKHRPLRAPGAHFHGYSTTAPYSETEVPQKPLEKEPQRGKRRFNVRDHGDILSTPLPPSETESASQPASGSGSGQHQSYRKNKSNQSYDVLNLGQYSKEELNEAERKVTLGPREFTPQDLPPRPRSTIARVKTNAKDTHDIFGTGQGVKERDTVQCKNRGASAPKKDTLYLFGNDEAPKKAPPKQYQASGLLDYHENEPRVSFKEPKRADAAAQDQPPQRQPSAKVASGSIFESKKAEAPPPPRGRARGSCVPKQNSIF